MKKKDLYKIIKDIVKEQKNKEQYKGPINPLTGEYTDNIDNIDKPIKNDIIGPSGPNTGGGNNNSTIDWEDCAVGTFTHTYNDVHMLSDSCDGNEQDIPVENIICCGASNNSGADKYKYAGDITVGVITNPINNSLSWGNQALNQNQCMCPNAVFDSADGDEYQNPNTQNNHLNPGEVDSALICCNCTVTKPWINNPTSTAAATVSIDPFTYSHFENWIQNTQDPNFPPAGTITMNNGRKCAGCKDSSATNYQIDDALSANNSLIYGCAVGSVDGVSSGNYTGLAQQTAADVGCCKYKGCMQYGAGGTATITNLFTAVNTSSQPTANMATTGTNMGINGLWTEDGTCTWEGCTFTGVGVNTSTVTGQDTSIYAASDFMQGNNPPLFTEDNSCNGAYGCTQSTNSPTYAFNGGANFDDGITPCYGCPDPTQFNTYNDPNSSGFPTLDCSGDPVTTPGQAPFGDVSCCSTVATGCMDNGTNGGAYEAGGANSATTLNNSSGEDRPAGWNPDGSGGTFPACNYDPNANTDNGSCVYTPCVGCTSTAFSFLTTLAYSSVTAVINTSNYNYSYDDGSCNFVGCLTSEVAVPNSPPIVTDNYVCLINPALCTGIPLLPDTATFGIPAFLDTTPTTCTYTLGGCTDPTACNYVAGASSDDGSCTFPATCELCEEVPPNTGIFGLNLNLTGAYVNDPACDCLGVTAHRCNREDITQSWDCITIGGNDPQVGDEFGVLQKQMYVKEESITEKVDLNDNSTVWVVDSLFQNNNIPIQNFPAKACNNTNWKCYCPSTGMMGWNDGTPGSANSHPHMCVQTTLPVPSNQGSPNFQSPPIFATYSECHDSFGCYNNTSNVKMVKPGEKRGGECHVSKGGQIQCNDKEPTSISNPLDLDLLNKLPGMDVDNNQSPDFTNNSTPNVPGLPPITPDSPEIRESKKLRKNIKNQFLLTEDQKLKEIIKRTLKRKK